MSGVEAEGWEGKGNFTHRIIEMRGTQGGA
jgi:hypothetical protein